MMRVHIILAVSVLLGCIGCESGSQTRPEHMGYYWHNITKTVDEAAEDCRDCIILALNQGTPQTVDRIFKNYMYARGYREVLKVSLDADALTRRVTIGGYTAYVAQQ